MLVTVVSLAPSPPLVCEFAADKDRLLGEWRESASPQIGEQVDVEFEMIGPHEIEYLSHGTELPSGFQVSGGRTIVTGDFVEFDKDDVLSLNVGPTFALFDDAPEPPLGFKGRVRATPSLIAVYTTGI